MGWFKDCLDNKKDIGRYAQVPAYFNLIGFGNKHDEEVGNYDVWLENTEKNLQWAEKNPEKVIGSIDKIDKHAGLAVVFVGMGPSIKRAVKHLRNLDKRFVIVATNSSAKYLLDRGIKPNYVIAIDGKPGSWTLKLGRKAKDIIGLFGTNVDPGALDDWPGKVLFIPHGVKSKKVMNKLTSKFGPPFPGGGNALNGATLVFVMKTEASIFLYVGNDLSFKKTYYADRKCQHDYDNVKFYARDIHGKTVYTLFPLWEYKVFLENLASQSHGDFAFINCSGGIFGTDVDGSLLPFIAQMELPEAIEEVKQAWEFEEKPIEEKTKIFYDEVYKSGIYSPQNTSVLWECLRDQVRFVKALDIGCGTGKGIKECRDVGLDVWGCDIADNREIWKEYGVDSVCAVAPANQLPYPDNSFDLIVCSEVMEHIPEKQISDCLKEAYRVGSERFIYTICLQEETSPVGGLVNSHITIKPREWWLDRFHEHGFREIKWSDVARGKAELTSIVIDCVKK